MTATRARPLSFMGGHDRPRKILIKGLSRRSLRLILLLALGGVTCLNSGSALAIGPRDPIEPPPFEERFTPPANGFDWIAESRFGRDGDRDGIIDYHWRDDSWPVVAERNTYDPQFVHSGFPLHFDGCQTAEEAAAVNDGRDTVNTYRWEFPSTSPLERRNCQVTHEFPQEGTYSVTFTIIGPGEAGVIGGPYTRDVTVKDFLIVSIGDSYASGEGNPDVFQQVQYNFFGFPEMGRPARWVDKRCHRSAYAGAAQAALAVEAADPKTSVTFLSFACSGATIDAPSWADGDLLDPYVPGRPEKPNGTGVLGAYQGADPLPQHRVDWTHPIPPQIKQVADTVGSRQIDALFMSGGGNDVGFVPISSVCVLFKNCMSQPVFINRDANGDPVKVSLRHRASADIAALADRYNRLAACLRPIDGRPCIVRTQNEIPGVSAAQDLEMQPLSPANVYVTQYPDQTKNGAGHFCGSMLDDIIPMPVAAVGAVIAPQILASMLGAYLGPFQPLAHVAGLGLTAYIFINHIPFELGGEEVVWAGNEVLPALNAKIAAAAAANNWELVSFGDEFNTHGYCATDNWIRRAEESQLVQGPFGPLRNETTGTLHPSIAGNRAYKVRMLEKLLPDLYPASTAPGPAPSFSATDASGSTNSRVGANGWLTGRCPAGEACLSDYAVLTVEAVDSQEIRGAELTINGVQVPLSGSAPNCAVGGGVTCTGELLENRTKYRWSFQLTDGAYRLDFSAGGRDGQVAAFTREARVDLHDPTGATATPSSSPGDSGWYRGPVEVTLNGTDVAGGSGVATIDYQLDGGAVLSTPPGTALELTENGVHTITYHAVDSAGRVGPEATLTLKIDTQAPTLDCAAADGAWHANDVSLGCTASDADSGLGQAGDDAFTLATSVPAGTETADAATGTRNVCDVAGNCITAGPISGNRVDRRAPSLLVPPGMVVNATSPAGALVILAASATDGADPNPVVRCTPASGSTFPVGITTVTCAATDVVGNSSQARFTVEVKGAAAQIVDLIDKTLAYMDLATLEATLKAQLQAVAAAVAIRPAVACTLLSAYIAAVKAAPAKAGLSPAEKAVLVEDATRIKAVVGCP